jgi:hypothetical protein
MDFELAGSDIPVRPPSEATLGKSLLGEPEALAIVYQDADGGRVARAEDEDASRKRILGQLLPAKLRQ